MSDQAEQLSADAAELWHHLPAGGRPCPDDQRLEFTTGADGHLVVRLEGMNSTYTYSLVGWGQPEGPATLVVHQPHIKHARGIFSYCWRNGELVGEAMLPYDPRSG